jgi:hypothetical protein
VLRSPYEIQSFERCCDHPIEDKVLRGIAIAYLIESIEENCDRSIWFKVLRGVAIAFYTQTNYNFYQAIIFLAL